MKKSSVMIIFLGFVLWAEFSGAVVYRNLVNDNSHKEDGGPESNNFNEEKTKNGIEGFDRQGDKSDLAREGSGKIANQDEEQGVTRVGKDGGCGQGYVGQEGSGEKAGMSQNGMEKSQGDAIENGSIVDEGKGTCICGKQGGIDGEDGQGDSGQGTEHPKNELDNGTEENGGQSNIESVAVDDKVGAENEEAESKQPGSEVGGAGGEDEETTYSGSGEHGGGGGEPDTTKSTEIKANGEQDEFNKNGGTSVDTEVQTIRFSPLDR